MKKKLRTFFMLFILMFVFGGLASLVLFLIAHFFGFGQTDVPLNKIMWLSIRILLITSLFIASLSLLPNIGSKSGGFEKAEGILEPFLKTYYKPNYQPPLKEQDLINSQRAQLEIAISLLNSARVERLRAGEFGRRDAIVALHEIGVTHRLLGDLNQAKSDFLKAYTEMQQLYSEYKSNDDYRFRLAQSLGAYCIDIGEVEYFSGNLVIASEWYKRAIPFAEEAGDKEYVMVANKLLERVKI